MHDIHHKNSTQDTERVIQKNVSWKTAQYFISLLNEVVEFVTI